MAAEDRLHDASRGKSLITLVNGDASQFVLTVARTVHQLSTSWFHDIKVSWPTGFDVVARYQVQLANWVRYGRTISKSVA
jgi:hypothetical protein